MTTPVADLGLVVPGATDTVVGVDESTGAARRFLLSNLPASSATLTAQAAAEAARDAAQLAAGVYATTAAGIAATASGDYFNVPSSNANESLILYLNNAGVAEEVVVYPSLTGIRENMGGYIINEYGDAVLPPDALFSASETGGAYDTSDIGTLWQDDARTIPVTAAGDPVEAIDDVSGNGYHLLQPDNTKRGTYRLDANGHGYVELPTTGFFRAASLAHEVTVDHHCIAAFTCTGAVTGSSAMIFGARSASAEAFGITHRSTNNAGTLLVSSANGVSAVTNNTALASITPGQVAIAESRISEALCKAGVNGGRLWEAASTTTAAFSMPSCRLGINISGSGLAATANVINFYGGVLIGRHLTDAERRGYINYLKTNTGIRGLEKQEYDVFGLAGQSNVIGQGDSATSVSVTWGEAVEFHDGFIKPLADPMRHYAENASGNVSGTGSAWPAFADEYYNLTGRRALLVGGGASGVGLTLASQWNTDPKYLDQLTDNMLAAKSFIETNGGTAVLRGVFWAGGENDALNQVSEAAFKADFIEFYTKVKEHLGARVKLLVLAIDQDTTAGHDSWFTAIRNAQISACADTAGMEMVMDYQGFETSGFLEDTIHWNQSALNTAGELAATATAALFP